MSVELPPPLTVRTTERQFLRRWADEKPPFEFRNGEARQLPWTTKPVMRLLDEVAFIVGSYRQQHGGAGGLRPAVDLCENQDSWYVAPAYAYWAIGKPEYANDVFLPPTLAVEIQSPGQTLGFLRTKCREYRDRGVDVAWLVVPARRAIEVFEPSADGVVRTRANAVESPHLPGFQFVVQELFAVLDD